MNLLIYSPSTSITESRLEGWLAVPNKQNIKRYGWRKQYVVVSRKKILFYNSENHKQNADPVMVLDIEYVIHFKNSNSNVMKNLFELQVDKLIYNIYDFIVRDT